jgi:hypothetical protein
VLQMTLMIPKTSTKSNYFFRPQTNNLAMALGTKIDPPSNALAIREKKKDPPFSQSRKSFMQTVMEKACASGDLSRGSGETSIKHSNPLFSPQTTSLAMALGMKIDPSSNAPAIRRKQRILHFHNQGRALCNL